MLSDAWIVLHPRGRNKPDNILPAPFSPTWDAEDDEATVAALSAVFKFDKHVARDFAPGFSPRIHLDEEQWFRIRRRFAWLPKKRVELAERPSDDYLAACAGTSRDVFTKTVRRTFRSARESCADVYGRIAPVVFGLAWKNVQEYPTVTSAIWLEAVREAAGRWVKTYWPDVCELLLSIPLQDRRYHDVYNLRAQIGERWRAQGVPTRNYRSQATFTSYCERIGVFRPGYRNRYVWGPVWRYGILSLTDP